MQVETIVLAGVSSDQCVSGHRLLEDSRLIVVSDVVERMTGTGNTNEFCAVLALNYQQADRELKSRGVMSAICVSLTVDRCTPKIQLALIVEGIVAGAGEVWNWMRISNA